MPGRSSAQVVALYIVHYVCRMVLALVHVHVVWTCHLGFFVWYPQSLLPPRLVHSCNVSQVQTSVRCCDQAVGCWGGLKRLKGGSCCEAVLGRSAKSSCGACPAWTHGKCVPVHVDSTHRLDTEAMISMQFRITKKPHSNWARSARFLWRLRRFLRSIDTIISVSNLFRVQYRCKSSQFEI